MSILSHDMPKTFRYLNTFFGFSAPPVESPGRSSPPTPDTPSSRHPMTSPEMSGHPKKMGKWITMDHHSQRKTRYTWDIHGILTINTINIYKPEILGKFHSLGPFSPVGQWDGPPSHKTYETAL